MTIDDIIANRSSLYDAGNNAGDGEPAPAYVEEILHQAAPILRGAHPGRGTATGLH